MRALGIDLVKRAGIFVIAGLALCLQGCAAVGLAVVGAGAGAGVGAGIDHTVNGIVYKTFAASLNNVRFATLKTFDRMAMPLTADQKVDDGWKLSATAADRTIDVELERLTARTTRMRVVANEGSFFFKDASTAAAIVIQTAQMLAADEEIAPARALPSADRKRRSS
jgi:Protein of unknown function (DUF3568)